MNILKSIISWFLVPFIGLNTFVDCFIKTNLLIPKLTLKKFIIISPYYLLLLTFVIRGLVSSWLNSNTISLIVSYNSTKNSSIVKVDCILCGFVFLEFLIIRFWFLNICNSDNFFKLIALYSRVSSVNQVKSIFLINFSTAYIAVTALPKDSLFYFIQFTKSESTIETVIIVISTIILIIYVGYFSSDMVLFYVASINTFYVINDEKNNLINKAIECINEREESFDQLMINFIKLIDFIEKFSGISQVLMGINKLIVLPLFSCFVIVYFVETTTNIEFMMKTSLIALGFFYTIRGYFCTWLFSTIDSDSIKLCKILFSISARNKHLSLTRRKYFNQVIDELSSDKNRFALREFGMSKITCGDLISSIANTIQLTLLGLGFYRINFNC